MDQAVVFEGVHFFYERKSRQVSVFEGVSFDVASSEAVALVGPSGSGKSTLLRMAAGLLRPTSGRVEVLGRSVTEISTADAALLRRTSIGQVFQDFELFPNLTALDNVALTWQLRGLGRSEARDRAEQALRDVAMEDRLDFKPGELSGGQQQRVAIARAVVGEPALILADEPTGSLDAYLRDEILELLLGARGEAAVLLVTHDPAVSVAADRVVEVG